MKQRIVAKLFRFCSHGPMRSLQDIADSNMLLRVWCFRCARGRTIEPPIERFVRLAWPVNLASAARRFRCIECRSSDAVALFPASASKAPPEPEWDPGAGDPMTELVAGIFHSNRSKRKRSARGHRARWEDKIPW